MGMMNKPLNIRMTYSATAPLRATLSFLDASHAQPVANPFTLGLYFLMTSKKWYLSRWVCLFVCCFCCYYCWWWLCFYLQHLCYCCFVAWCCCCCLFIALVLYNSLGRVMTWSRSLSPPMLQTWSKEQFQSQHKTIYICNTVIYLHESPLNSTKSLTNVDAPAPIPAWSENIRQFWLSIVKCIHL